MSRFILRRVLSGLAVLALITYLSFLLQEFAARTQLYATEPLGQTAWRALQKSASLGLTLVGGSPVTTATRPPSAFGGTSGESAGLGGLLADSLLNSLGLLLLAMLLGGLLGGLIGLGAAASRRSGVSLGLILASIVGISTPSFFLGVLLQYLEILFYRNTGVRLVPVGGFGWDSHLVLPVLVLAARPIAQVARLTYVRVSAVLDEDYVRTAHAKGLPPRLVWQAHIIPNVASTVLTAMGMSLRLALSSLAVVEVLFGWPGAGHTLLEMLRARHSEAATVLVLALGAMFIVVNLALDILYRVLDPRLRQSPTQVRVETSWPAWLGALLASVWGRLTLRGWRARHQAAETSVASLSEFAGAQGAAAQDATAEMARRRARRHAWLQATAGNPALWAGALIGLLLLAVVIVGPSLAPHNPYVSATRLVINGEQVTPPVAPDATYRLGTDQQGRDILSLLLVGAQRTLAMALFAVIVRLLLGGALGFVAGWFAGSRLDRAIMGLAEALGAFPALLLAMLLIYAIGVRQGLSAFVVGLAFVGWGEVMQTVRSQVMAIKPSAYVEGAVSVGLDDGQILSAHVLPNVWPTMVSLAFLEMGGVLMVLGELGFLGVFIGGGFAAEGDALPSVVYYDMPEWSVMLANSWRGFRSTPWAMLYPALAFFVAILGFTFLGEGLRRMTERLTLSFRSLFNRYTLAAALVVTLGANWMFQSTGFFARYAPAARIFDTARALRDIGFLASPELNGRLSGSADAEHAADWIAGEFARAGLQPGGKANTYFQPFVQYYRDLSAMPKLTLRGPQGEEIQAVYGRDFGQDAGPYDVGGVGAGQVVLLKYENAVLWLPDAGAASLGLSPEEGARRDRTLLRLWGEADDALPAVGYAGLLTLSPGALSPRYELLGQVERTAEQAVPSVRITGALADRLLAPLGYTTAELLKQWQAESGNPTHWLPTDWSAEVSVPTHQHELLSVRNVIAVWPGEDVALDREAIVIAAHYDGLGRLPDGTLYAGANDNASGVATLLEMIRTLKAQDFRPKRTLIFYAWIGGERHRAVDYAYALKAKTGLDTLQIVAGLELEGVGAGTGSSALIWHATRERLVETVRQAARQMRTPLSTRGSGLHQDTRLWPLPSATVPSASIAWSGSDTLAHRPEDTPERIDAAKIAQVGKMMSLAVMVLASDPAY